MEYAEGDKVIVAGFAHFEAQLSIPLGVQVSIAYVGLLLLALADDAYLRVSVAIGVHWPQSYSLINLDCQL